jgi:UDP-N-acetylmuramoylalanine--D-glutamate ligase
MKRVSLFGYAKTTKAIAKNFQNVTFYDDNCNKPFSDDDGYKVKPSSDFDPNYSDMEIVSPGIAPYNPLIKKAKNLISEYDFFKDTTPLKIWISGTNGKTTTTQMMQYLLEEKGSICGGNIGIPLANLDKDAKIWILETSSFTMHYTNQTQPNIYILLPLSPDHLSWHGSMQEYIDVKLKPIKSMKEGEIAIVPHKYKDIKTNAYIISYKDEQDLAKYFDIQIEDIKFKGAFLLDALLAMAVDKILFDTINYNKINQFQLDPHRQEELKDAYSRLWVNDTKATNLDATICAVKRYEKLYIHLILGGDDKGVNLDELFLYLKTKKLTIYTIGSNKNKLCSLAINYGIKFQKCINLEDAVKKIAKNLNKDEVAILSPAAASLDEFTSYAQRGDDFKELIRNL